MDRLRFASLAGLGALTLAGAANAEAKPPVVARMETCLRTNVDRVVASDADMASAATFLVTYACADEVTAAARYERNSAYVKMFAAMAKATPPPAPAAGKSPPAAPEFNASVNPDTGELVLPSTAPGGAANPLSSLMPMMDGLFGQLLPTNVPVSIRKLAGELVLAAHERRLSRPR